MKLTRYYGRTREEYYACKSNIDDANRTLVSMMISFMILIFGCVNVILLGFPQARGFMQLYTITSYYLVALLQAVRYIPFLKKDSILQSYLLLFIVLSFGIHCAIIIPNKSATVFPMLLVLMPLFFIDNMLRMSAFLIVNVVIYAGVVYRYKMPQEAMWDTISAFSFGGIAIVLHYFVHERILRFFVAENTMRAALHAYEETNEELRRKAQMDMLTGLYNRAGVIEKVNEYFEDSKNEPGDAVFGIMDIDEFKQINDRYGHQIGDHVISSVANVLLSEFGSNCIIGRLGGDEFIMILLNKGNDRMAILKIMHRILSAIEQIKLVNGAYVTASIGLTFIENGKHDFVQGYYEADKALYRAKALGKNQCCFYEKSM